MEIKYLKLLKKYEDLIYKLDGEVNCSEWEEAQNTCGLLMSVRDELELLGVFKNGED